MFGNERFLPFLSTVKQLTKLKLMKRTIVRCAVYFMAAHVVVSRLYVHPMVRHHRLSPQCVLCIRKSSRWLWNFPKCSKWWNLSWIKNIFVLTPQCTHSLQFGLQIVEMNVSHPHRYWGTRWNKGRDHWEILHSFWKVKPNLGGQWEASPSKASSDQCVQLTYSVSGVP